MNIEELEAKILQDTAELESLSNLIINNMLVGELAQHLDRLKTLEKALTINIVKVEDLKEIELNNSKLKDF